MKKQIFLSFLAIPFFNFGQSMDQNNEPTVGQNNQLFMCDSLTDPLNSISGSGVVWDYSEIAGFSGQTKVIEIVDPASTANALDFPTSTKAFSIQGSITNYFNSSAAERVSQGFVFQEPSFGTVLATFNTDEQTTVQYPFSSGDAFEDAFAGQLSFNFNGLPQNPACTGNSYASIDGNGTLKLPNATNLNNVIRYKIVDTLYTQVVFVIPLDIELIRTQYEYYDYANGNLPVFIHSSVTIQQIGATTPLLEQSVVLSAVEPTNFVGLTTNVNEQIKFFPNPSNGTIIYTNSLNVNSTINIVDHSGRIVFEKMIEGNTANLDLNHLKTGTYIANIITENGSRYQSRITIQ
jgi:hypothetical protein